MPISISNFESLIQEILKEQKLLPQLILIAGCSRSGKSTLASQISSALEKRHLSTQTLSLDSWIISHDRRRAESTVLERFEIDEAQSVILALLQGQKVQVPFYDNKSRRRIKEKTQELILTQSYLIVEGVVALALPKLVKMAAISIFVEVDDQLRQKRLREYMSQRQISKQESEELMASREAEEIPLIKKTRENAKFSFSTHSDPRNGHNS